MFKARLLAAIAVFGLAATSVSAQTTAPASPTRPVVPSAASTAPAAKAPAVTPPAVTPPAVTPPIVKPPLATAPAVTATPATAGKLINVNTATAKELDALPTVGKARAAAIVAERAKGKFKDWSDFDTRMAGTTVNAGVKAKIKDRVTF